MTSREARKREARSLIVGAIGAVGALLILLAMVEAPATMDPQALASALSTIAQVAAALAALIGVLGLWRLDRLREEQAQILQLFRAVKGGDLRDELIRYGDESYVREVRSWVEAGHVAPESAVARVHALGCPAGQAAAAAARPPRLSARDARASGPCHHRSALR